ncbi:MAG TPA: hypothetical protein VMC80_01350 [Patescibacteria group bacterium]|nr:hypothetical protein [Patescibacteria group bacterium]
MTEKAQKTEKLKNPWAVVYSREGFEFIGEVLKEEWNGALIAHSESHEILETFDTAGQVYIRRFGTPEEVRGYLIETYSENALVTGIFNQFLRRFPSARLENIVLEQSSPKLTEEEIEIERIKQEQKKIKTGEPEEELGDRVYRAYLENRYKGRLE